MVAPILFHLLVNCRTTPLSDIKSLPRRCIMYLLLPLVTSIYIGSRLCLIALAFASLRAITRSRVPDYLDELSRERPLKDLGFSLEVSRFTTASKRTIMQTCKKSFHASVVLSHLWSALIEVFLNETSPGYYLAQIVTAFQTRYGKACWYVHALQKTTDSWL